jgi:hypothetical protein
LLPDRPAGGDFLSVDIAVSDIVASAWHVNLDLKSLRDILANDDERLAKFWQYMGPRVVALFNKKLPELESLTQDRIGGLCHVCDIQIYKQGNTVSANNGGLVLYGGSGFELVKPGSTVEVNSGKYMAFMHFEPELGIIIADGALTNEELGRITFKQQAARLKANRAMGNAIERLMVPRGNVSDDGASYALNDSDMDASR